MSTTIPGLNDAPLPSELEQKGFTFPQLLSSFNKVFTPKQKHSQAWSADIAKWQYIGKDAAAVVLSLSERRLTETIATAESINKRTDRLLTITVALFTVIVGYLLKDARSESVDLFLVAICLLSLLPLGFSSFFIIKNFAPNNIHVPGSPPSKLLTTARFDGDLTPEEQYLDLVLDQAESYQESIEHNLRYNRKRMRNNNLAQVGLICLPFFLLLVYLITLSLLSY
jgi:hypothetical protein